MLLGNPSGATEDSANRDNYLMLKPYFAVAYNNSAGEPRWVSWRLCASDLGDAPRKRTFDPDDSLPGGFNVIVTRDYTGSGFDRGHMCDHSDRAATLESSYATFVMTNIVPQAPNNNRKAWAQLENYSRELARAGDRLHITSGPCGRGGVGSKGQADTLAGGKIIVPAETWKVIVVTHDTGTDDLSNVNAGDRVIAVDVPNDNDQVGEEWAGFRCTTASIEAKTGLHFFTALPPAIRTALDQKLDTERITIPRPLIHTAD
jgi:endonuclease G